MAFFAYTSNDNCAKSIHGRVKQVHIRNQEPKLHQIPFLPFKIDLILTEKLFIFTERYFETRNTLIIQFTVNLAGNQLGFKILQRSAIL